MPPLAKKIAQQALNRTVLRECLLAWGLVTLTLFAFTRLTFIPLLVANAGGLVAVTMLLVPRFTLPADSDDPTDYLLPRQNPARSLLTAGVVLALIGVFYLPAIHIWRSHVFDEHADFSIGALRRPQAALLGSAPDDIGTSAFLTYHTAGRTTLRWQPEQPSTITIRADHPLYDVDNRRSTHAIDQHAGPDRPVELQFAHRSARTVELQLRSQSDAPVLHTPGGRTVTGTDGHLDFTIHYSMFWMLTFALSQAVIIALPEEAFFRGYLQRRLGEAGLTRVVLRVAGLEVSTANIVTSVLFALAHLPAVFNPFRLATFFPSLLFGAMRDRDRSILGAILVHTIGNLIMQLASGIYQ